VTDVFAFSGPVRDGFAGCHVTGDFDSFFQFVVEMAQNFVLVSTAFFDTFVVGAIQSAVDSAAELRNHAFDDFLGFRGGGFVSG